MIYDLFSFGGYDLDILEIRFNILDKYVDYFVLGESEISFSGKPKPLYYKENIERFKKWNDKVIYLECNDSVIPKSPEFDNPTSFERAYFQKENLKRGVAGASDDSIVYFGDVDEIWKPQNIQDDKVYNLEQLNYCYYLNNRSSERWVGTIVGKWKTIKNGSLNDFRAFHKNELPNGGWHFTNMGGEEQIIKKLETYDHQEYNNSLVKEDIKFKIENGEDYVGREIDWEGKPFNFTIDESELPEYIINNKEKYVAYFK